VVDETIARLRLLAQRITGEKFRRPAEVVRWMGALQAQDHPASLWAMGVRTSAATLKDIDAAVEKREIARTWPMRGTLHWVPAEDLRWMVALMAPRAMAKAAARTRQLEIDDATLSKARNLLGTRLRDGGQITRPAAYRLFEDAGMAPAGQRGIHILSLLAHEAYLCFGPHEGKQPAFVLAEEWLPAGRTIGQDEALLELARRYFRSHGPATAHDFAWWTGLTLTGVRAAIESVRGELEMREFDGKQYWMAPGLEDSRANRDIHLLPGFDEFILGYTDRTAVLSPEHGKRLVPGNNGMFLAAVVADSGRVLGTWTKLVAKGRVRVGAEMFEAGEGEPAGLAEAAARYAHFLGLEPG
jgi:hypothetical protein